MSDPQFGRYRVVSPIARGGMAEVFAGRLVGEAGFNRVVAIKSIRPDLIEEPAYVTMFLDEARLAANVQSPHVVHTFDLGRTDDGVPFMVMELVIGATVGELIRACQPSPMPLPFALAFLVQSLRGLDDAHAAVSPAGEPLRIVHRDLAPKNILVGVDGRARIMDFGIAHAVERLTRTTTGQIKGTVRYFSPEQADLQPLDQRSDIFSMGIVAYEMLTGTRLFAGRNMIEIYQQVMSQRIPDVREVVRDIPQGVAQVVAKALERDPAKRFQRALEFANALSEQIADPPDDQDLRSFVRTNLPAHARELQRLLREDSSAFRTEVLATHEDDAPPTVVTGGPSMTQLPPRPAAEPEASGVVGAVGADVSTTSASAVESRGWWSRFVSWLVGRQEAERHEGYSKQLGSLLARRQDSVSTRRALEPPGYVLVFPRHEASRDGDARLRALRAALARLVL